MSASLSGSASWCRMHGPRCRCRAALTSKRCLRAAHRRPVDTNPTAGGIVDVVAAIEDLRPLRDRLQQVAQRRHRAVVQIGRAQPDAVEERARCSRRVASTSPLRSMPNAAHDLVGCDGAVLAPACRSGRDWCRLRATGSGVPVRSLAWHDAHCSSKTVLPAAAFVGSIGKRKLRRRLACAGSRSASRSARRNACLSSGAAPSRPSAESMITE